MRQTPNRRWPLVVVSIISVLVLLALALLNTLLWYDKCGGDGGSPFSANASPMGEMCTQVYGGNGGSVVGIGVVILLGFVAAAWVAVSKRTGRLLTVALVICLAAHTALAAPTMMLEDRCTPEQRATLPQRDCETYR